MLKLIDIEKTFFANTVNERKALNKINLNLDKGEIVTIIGSNGAGKSTLFSLIAGGYLSDNGKITLDNEDITFLREYKRSKNIGRLFQDPMHGTAPNMTIEENLTLAYLRSSKKNKFFSRLSKSEKNFFKEKLEILNMGLENRLSSPVGLLSGGQRQALTLLMATLVTPKLLLLDEHTAALDPETSLKVLDITKKIIKENEITCLMITHDIKMALDIGTRTIMMNNGKITIDIKGEERKNMSVEKLLQKFKEHSSDGMLSDRILLS